MVNGIIITKNNNIKNKIIDTNNLGKNVDLKGYNKILEIHSWNYNDNIIYVYGWLDGNRKIINKHEFPEPIDNLLLYGDCIILMKNKKGKYIDFTKEDYNIFYEEMFGGFDDCNSDDDTDLDDDDYDYNDGFLVRG